MINWREYNEVPKLIPRLRNKSYEKRLNELNLFSLSKRRLRGDLIEIFKNVHMCDNININDYISTDFTSTTRNNDFKITGKRFRLNEAKHFFFNRIVNIWNSLPAQIINSITIEYFKKISISIWHLFTKMSISFLSYLFIYYYYFFLNRRRLVLHLFSLSFTNFMLHGIASSSGQLRLEERVGVEEPSTFLSFCLYQVDIIVRRLPR